MIGENVKMFKVVVVTISGKIISREFNTSDEAQNYILELVEKKEVKRADILNKKTGERQRDITKGL